MRNKYQEALDNLVHCKSITRCKECKHKNLCTMERDSKILQELVDKVTPIKVIKAAPYGTTRASKCPICNKRYSRAHKKEYCPNCGQKFDWEE